MAVNRHPILFVGAGPGDPDLITVAGRNALEAADLIVYAGSLVSRDMLGWARPEARCVDSAGLNLSEIVNTMAEGHDAGLYVVRLHTGDPSLYGAIREQFDLLTERGIDYKIIPGVTAAFAAAAALGVEFTLPELSQSLILTRIAGRTPVPSEEDLALLADHRTSLVIYLSAARAEAVAQALATAYGWDAPVAVVYRASWPDQKIIISTVENLSRDMSASDVNRQALICVGRALTAQLTGHRAAQSKLYDAGFSHGYRRGDDDSSSGTS